MSLESGDFATFRNWVTVCAFSSAVRGPSSFASKAYTDVRRMNNRVMQQRNASKMRILVVDVLNPSKRRLEVFKNNINNVFFLNRCKEHIIFRVNFII